MRICDIPKRKETKQLGLFENSRKLTTGYIRYAIGDFYEDLTSHVFEGVALSDRSDYDYCPDIKLEDGRYLESKSVCKSHGTSYVYTERVAKDLKFVREGNELHYVFWIHDKIIGIEYEDELRQFLLKHTTHLLAISFPAFFKMCETLEVRKTNLKYPYETYYPVSLGHRRLKQVTGWHSRLEGFQCPPLTPKR